MNVEGRILDVLSSHGGEQIMAGPPMEQLVTELRGVFDDIYMKGDKNGRNS